MEKKILEILEDVNEEILSYDGNNMMVDGIVSSFEIIEIISTIEEEFDIEIDAKYVVAENFRNKESIIELIRLLLTKEGI